MDYFFYVWLWFFIIADTPFGAFSGEINAITLSRWLILTSKNVSIFDPLFSGIVPPQLTCLEPQSQIVIAMYIYVPYPIFRNRSTTIDVLRATVTDSNSHVHLRAIRGTLTSWVHLCSEQIYDTTATAAATSTYIVNDSFTLYTNKDKCGQFGSSNLKILLNFCCCFFADIC